MNKLRPTLWRTCRVIANLTRLRLLWKIFEKEGLCVDELAKQTVTSRPNATIQLRALNSRGLICRCQKGKRVIYRAEPNSEVEFAEELLAALRTCYTKRIHPELVFRQATALTHPARIELVRLLQESEKDAAQLVEMSGLSEGALILHLNKLESRGFIACRKGGVYHLARPAEPLGACLMQIVCAKSAGRVKIACVISGGQTGADRAALDAAIACGVPHGGWCPQGRLAEDDRISLKYNLQEMDSSDYPSRTRANIEASDVTLIYSRGPLTGGSLLTKQLAEKTGKPCIHIDLLVTPGRRADEDLATMGFPAEQISLNVAGPRASNDPEIYAAVYEAVTNLLQE